MEWCLDYLKKNGYRCDQSLKDQDSEISPISESESNGSSESRMSKDDLNIRIRKSLYRRRSIMRRKRKRMEYFLSPKRRGRELRCIALKLYF